MGVYRGCIGIMEEKMETTQSFRLSAKLASILFVHMLSEHDSAEYRVI